MKRRLINVFGHLPMSYGMALQLEEIKGFFKEMDVEVNIPAVQGKEAYLKASDAAFSLCLSDSSSNVAEFFYTTYQIPFHAGYPIGIGRMIELLEKMMKEAPEFSMHPAFIKIYTRYCQRKLTSNLSRKGHYQKIFFVGDTVLYREIRQCFLKDFELEATIIKTEEDVKALNRSDVLFIGDPVIRELYDASSKINWLDVPYGGFNSNEYLYDINGWFGLHGYELLKKQLK